MTESRGPLPRNPETGFPEGFGPRTETRAPRTEDASAVRELIEELERSEDLVDIADAWENRIRPYLEELAELYETDAPASEPRLTLEELLRDHATAVTVEEMRDAQRAIEGHLEDLTFEELESARDAAIKRARGTPVESVAAYRADIYLINAAKLEVLTRDEDTEKFWRDVEVGEARREGAS